MYFLVNATSPKLLDVATSNFAGKFHINKSNFQTKNASELLI